MTTRRKDTVRLPLPAAGALQAYVSYSSTDKDFAVVYVHGFGATRLGVKSEALEAACERRGWTFASFDFRGHGQSTGTMLELRGSILLEDLDALREYLIGRGIRRFCPVGSSMGGWAAAWFAMRHPNTVPGCVLLAPALDFPRSRWAGLTEDERRLWQDTGRLRVRNEHVDTEIGYGLIEEKGLFQLDRLEEGLTQPVLIFQGLEDEVVAYSECLEFIKKAVQADVELHLFKNGDHRLLSYRDQMAEAACEFFVRL